MEAGFKTEDSDGSIMARPEPPVAVEIAPNERLTEAWELKGNKKVKNIKDTG